MGEKIEFTLSIVPIEAGKPKHTRTGHTYTPPKKRIFKEQVILLSRKHRPLKPWDGPIGLIVYFYFQIPKYRQKERPAPFYHIIKPDSENLLKGVKDSLTQAQFWIDDCQICDETVYKLYAQPGTVPRIVVSIERL